MSWRWKGWDLFVSFEVVGADDADAKVGFPLKTYMTMEKQPFEDVSPVR